MEEVEGEGETRSLQGRQMKPRQRMEWDEKVKMDKGKAQADQMLCRTR